MDFAFDRPGNINHRPCSECGVPSHYKTSKLSGKPKEVRAYRSALFSFCVIVAIEVSVAVSCVGDP